MPPNVLRRIGTEGEPVLTRCLAEIIEYDARLYARRFRLGVQFVDPVHVPGEIQHDRDIHGLSRNAGAAAPGDYWRSMTPAHG